MMANNNPDTMERVRLIAAQTLRKLKAGLLADEMKLSLLARDPAKPDVFFLVTPESDMQALASAFVFACGPECGVVGSPYVELHAARQALSRLVATRIRAVQEEIPLSFPPVPGARTSSLEHAHSEAMTLLAAGMRDLAHTDMREGERRAIRFFQQVVHLVNVELGAES